MRSIPYVLIVSHPLLQPKGEMKAAGPKRMDKLRKKFLGDILFLLGILIFTIIAFVRFNYNPSVILAGSLALTFFVAAEIVLTR